MKLTAQPIDDLPPALPALWRAVERGYRAEPVLLVVSLALCLLAALPDALWRCGSCSWRRES